MSESHFFRDVGIGLAVGAAATAAMTMKPKKKALQAGAGKAMKAVGDAVENITGHMGK